MATRRIPTRKRRAAERSLEEMMRIIGPFVPAPDKPLEPHGKDWRLGCESQATSDKDHAHCESL